MKKIKTTLAIAVALATGVGTSALAQNVKQDTITLSLSGTEQISVGNSPSINNSGTFSEGPKFYKTAAIKLTEKDLLHYMGFTVHGNANFYGSKATLVLVQAELSGFFNMTPDLALSEADRDMDGSFESDDFDSSTAIQNSSDSLYVQLDNGRHLLVNPIVDTEYPVGHLQPWGQIYVQYTSGDQLICENVTYFFALSVQECYDCFYLNSFVTDSQFKVQTTSQVGPPCCGTSSTLTGKGKDRYYLTLSFDDTVNNPYLSPDSSCWVGVFGADFEDATIPSDGINPDTIPYSDLIKSGIGRNTPYVARFTLNGILTYTWNLQFFNKDSDIAPDFIGTGAYAANGYGFVALFCNLFTGTANFTEKLIPVGKCCTGEDWADWWYGVGAEYTDEDDVIDTQYFFGFYPTPFNVSTSLSYHENFNTTYPYNAGNFAPSAWPTPSIVSQFWVPFTAGF